MAILWWEGALKKVKIAGKGITLRISEEADAEFILSLRLDPELNKFINKTESSVENQKKWISAKQKQENDYHMIIESKNGQRLGTVSIYNIKGKKFEWGRWLISKKAPFYVAIESALLVYSLAFNELGLEKAVFGVNNLNKSVVRFHKNFGAHVIKKDDCGTWFIFEKKYFKNTLKKYKKFHLLELSNGL